MGLNTEGDTTMAPSSKERLGVCMLVVLSPPPTSMTKHPIIQSRTRTRSWGPPCTGDTGASSEIPVCSPLLTGTKATGCNACKGCAQGQREDHEHPPNTGVQCTI